GVAIAADGAVPGDPLYPLDMNLEQLGIGDGGETERIAESEILMARGDEDEAMTLLGEYLEILDSAGNTEAINKVERHLELALTKSNPRAAAAQEKVAELKTFIEVNKGQGIGLDGKEFGQGVAEIARSKVKPADPGEPADKTTGPPDNAGPKKEKNNTPEQAGPKDKDRGKPDK
ncbi:MAG: hypothetical protein WBM90_09460, partial [Acidimicrobiia bacterium]